MRWQCSLEHAPLQWTMTERRWPAGLSREAAGGIVKIADGLCVVETRLEGSLVGHHQVQDDRCHDGVHSASCVGGYLGADMHDDALDLRKENCDDNIDHNDKLAGLGVAGDYVDFAAHNDGVVVAVAAPQPPSAHGYDDAYCHGIDHWH